MFTIYLTLFFKINPLFGHVICVNDHFTIIIIHCIYIMLININLVFFGLYNYNLHGYCCIVLLASRASHTLIVQLRKIFVIYIYIYICFLYIYIYIYIYTFVRRARAVHARATRKRRTGRLRFNGQYNRLKNGYFSSKL